MSDQGVIREHAVFEARTYRFTFNNRWGWAHFTIVDATLELLMTSDYGNYAHRWSGNFGGRTLTEVLASKGRHQYDCHYIVEKLQSSTRSHELDDVVDTEKTEQEIRKVIAERLRKGEISEELVREVERETLIDQWVSEECNSHALPRELAQAAGDDVWHCVRMCKSGWYEVLANELLPWFCRWLAEKVVNKQQEAVPNVGT